MYLHKGGVSLRKVSESDSSELINLKNESWWGTHGFSLINEKDQLSWINNTKDVALIGDYEKIPSGVIIYSNINKINRSLSISGSVYENRRQHAFYGFCAGIDFAFEMLNMHRIEAEILEYNRPSQIIQIQKLGMVVEGVKKKAVYKCGNFYDSIVISLLRSDWINSERIISYQGVCNNSFNHDLFQRIINRYSFQR